MKRLFDFVGEMDKNISYQQELCTIHNHTYTLKLIHSPYTGNTLKASECDLCIADQKKQYYAAYKKWKDQDFSEEVEKEESQNKFNLLRKK